MTLLILITIEAWFLCSILFVLHYHNARFGLAPLLFYLAAAITILQFLSPLQLNAEPFEGLTLATVSDVLIPFILLGILILYIVNGTEPARSAIYGILLITAFTLIFILVSRLQFRIFPSENAEVAPIFNPNIRLVVASIFTFIADFVVLIIFYQGAKNHLPAIPDWLTPVFALIAGVWCDSITFYLLGTLGTPHFAQFLPGDVFGKTFVVMISSPIIIYYLNRLAP